MKKRRGNRVRKLQTTEPLNIPHLPLELVTQVMEYLPQVSRRCAASVSRYFNAAAHTAGLELHRTIYYMYDDIDWRAALDTFAAVVDHFEAKAQTHHASGLVLSLSCRYMSNERVINSAGLSDILAVVTRSLPLLVGLLVGVPTHIFGDVFAAVAFPAERLRVLCLSQALGYDEDVENGAVPVPADLLGSRTPRLTDVVLNGVALNLSGASIPAFARVQRLTVRCCRKPLIKLASSFPALRALSVCGPPLRDMIKPLDLSGLSLRWLLMVDSIGGCRFVSPPLDIPKIDNLSSNMVYQKALWPTGVRDFGAHIRCVRGGLTMDSSIATVDAGRAWTQTYFGISGCSHGLTAFYCLSRLHTALVSLTVAEELLPHLLCDPHTLEALRELLVDCTRASEARTVRVADGEYDDIEHMPDDACRVRCPVLARVTVFAIGRRARVKNSKLACLGRALRLGQATTPGTLELALASIRLTIPEIREPLRQIYSPIRQFESADGVVPPYYDHRIVEPRSIH